MPHSFSLAASMNLEHSIKEGSHERYPDHLQCFRNIKKIKYPDFQAMTYGIFQNFKFLCGYWVVTYQTKCHEELNTTVYLCPICNNFLKF